MKHFKHLKRGMSLIEVVAAIGVFAVFGTSIFLMQQFLFNRMMISQKKLIAVLRMQNELMTYQANIVKEVLEDNGPVEKSLAEHTKNFTQPDMTIRVTTKSDLCTGVDKTDSSFKIFKNLHLVCVQAEQSVLTPSGLVEQGKVASDSTNEYARSYMFVYIPEVTKK